MSLPQSDVEFLTGRGMNYAVSTEANMTCVVVLAYRLPACYQPQQSDLLLRLNPGYPDVQPDMWWFNPPVRPCDGRAVPATDVTEQHLGRQWQRWSRHFNPGQWQPGIDSLESFFALIRKELERWGTAQTT